MGELIPSSLFLSYAFPLCRQNLGSEYLIGKTLTLGSRSGFNTYISKLRYPFWKVREAVSPCPLESVVIMYVHDYFAVTV